MYVSCALITSVCVDRAITWLRGRLEFWPLCATVRQQGQRSYRRVPTERHQNKVPDSAFSR